MFFVEDIIHDLINIDHFSLGQFNREEVHR